MDEAIDHTSTVVLSANDLRKGMYVSYLDRPWLETSFPFKGFEIKTDGELKQLRTTCEYVFIDGGVTDQARSASVANRRRPCPVGDHEHDRR
jgi:hypothetical protein